MKKLSIIFLGSTLLFSCVAPRDKRALYDDVVPESSSSTGGTGSGSTGGGGVSIDDGSSGTGTGSGSTGSNIPDYLKKCKWSLDGQTGFAKTGDKHLGDYTICQSTVNQSEVFVQLKTPLPSTRLCVIPTYSASDRAIFLGEARCQFIESNTNIYRFPLVKNRDHGKYQNFQINSVMVMKEASYFFDSPFYRDQISYDAFFICSVNLDLHGDPKYCDAFKSKGEYVYQRF